MTDQELYEAMGIQHFDGGGYADMLTAKNMNATEDAPMPEVLAKNGHEVVPIYEKKSLLTSILMPFIWYFQLWPHTSGSQTSR